MMRARKPHPQMQAIILRSAQVVASKVLGVSK